jgi:hypothetical protein
MKIRWLWILIVTNLLVLVALTFIYPQLMVSPGPLVPAHENLATDCFACHSPLRGASAELCIVCHTLTDIGIRSTKGVAIKALSAISSRKMKMSFHQELTEQNCMACHSDHVGPKLTQINRKRFSHGLLRAEMRTNCNSCHAAPSNEMHRNLSISCAKCHKADAWKPASFDHASLPSNELDKCEKCHKAPTNAQHRRVLGNCIKCHSIKAWKPATFKHDKFFVLDGDHNASCATCHVDDDHSKYTCYGCHEHTPANVRNKHNEEGIQNVNNCVKCHRSAEGESEGRDPREGGGGRKRGEED